MVKILLILFVLYTPCYSGVLEGIGKIFGIEANKTDNSEQIMNGIKETASNNKLLSDTVLGLSNKMTGFETTIGDVKNSLEANLSATANLSNKITGVDNSIRKTVTETISAGRDSVKTVTTTNSTDLMKFIFEKWYLLAGGFFTFLLSFFAGVWGLIKFQANLNKKILDIVLEQLRLENEYSDKLLNKLFEYFMRYNNEQNTGRTDKSE